MSVLGKLDIYCSTTSTEILNPNFQALNKFKAQNTDDLKLFF